MKHVSHRAINDRKRIKQTVSKILQNQNDKNWNIRWKRDESLWVFLRMFSEIWQIVNRGRFSFHLKTSNGKPRSSSMSNVAQNTTVMGLRLWDWQLPQDGSMRKIMDEMKRWLTYSVPAQTGISAVFLGFWLIGGVQEPAYVRNK